MFRSDIRTNFVGAMDDLGVDRINVENNDLRDLFDNVGTKWILNPPNAPYFGGAWVMPNWHRQKDIERYPI